MQRSTSGGGFFTQFGNVFLDTLDTIKDKVIDREFGEDSGEHSEGIAEFGNPNTVSQPVRPSQLPSGQPFLSNISQQIGVPPSVLMIGGGALAVLLVLKLSKG
ncbi:MAG: hypothetical protein KTR20_12230 [Cellvibrionaceae bacterium]|nr:hypothetical protein [Cellvibrionaceae bacterium]